MTDLIAAPGADADQTTAVTETIPPNDGGPAVEWAPREPAPKKHRTALWVSIGVGALLVAAGAASTILIAPGTTIAGVPVGGLTPGAAADVVNSRLSDMQIALTDVDGSPTITGAELGATVDAKTLADQAFADHPMWNLGAWLPEPIDGDITLDPVTAHEALRGLVPSSYEDAVDAGVVFDAKAQAYTATPSVPGSGIDLAELTGTVAGGLAAGDQTLNYSGAPAEAPAAVSDDDAAGVAEQLNTMVKSIGFYIGDERTVPVTPEVAATWLDVVDEDGELHVVADEAAIQTAVDALPDSVNRAAVDAETIVNASGSVLDTITEGVDGRTLGDTATLASDFAEKLEAGDAVQQLEVTEVPFVNTTLKREIDINLATQTVTAIENDVAVNSWSVSSGAGDSATHTGSFQVGWKTSSQNMGNSDLTQAPNYYQPDVPWVMYFNGDEALHGVYWHSNWGTPMSHGCVGMPIPAAEWLYNWSPEGVNVYVHY